MASQPNPGSANPRTSPAAIVTNPPEQPSPGLTSSHVHRPAPTNVAPAGTTAKKGKAKKTTDPAEVGKLLAAKIGQLESDAAGERSEEQEIGEWEGLFRQEKDVGRQKMWDCGIYKEVVVWEFG